MPLYKVGPTGLRVLRTDHTYIEYPPGQVVAFAQLPEAYQGELQEIKADPKHGAYEDKSRRPKQDKSTEAPGLLDLTVKTAEER